MLNVFINTWGNYNENGADGGEWVTLPMDAGDLADTLDRIAENMGDFDPEFFVNDYEYTTEFEYRKIGEMENIEDLNDEMQRLADLDQWEQETFCAAVEYWGAEYVDLDSLDDYILHKDITNEYDLGYYFIHEAGIYDLDNMGPLANYFDYEAFGRDINLETDGGFTSFGWIEQC